MNQAGRPTAFDDPRTRAALRDYRQHGAIATACGLAGVTIATIIINTAPNNEPQGVLNGVTLAGIGLGGVALYAGLVALLRSARMAFHFRREAWATRHASYRIAAVGANGQPALLVKADALGGEAVCSLSTTVFRYRRLPQGRDVALVFVGDPTRWSVVAPPDLSVLVVAKRSVVPGWKKRLRKIATAW